MKGTLAALDEELPGVDLQAEIRTTVGPIREKYQPLISRFNINGLLPEILA